MIIRARSAIKPWHEVLGVVFALAIVTILTGMFLNQNTQQDKWDEWRTQRSKSIPSMMYADSVGMKADTTVIAKLDTALALLKEVKRVVADK